MKQPVRCDHCDSQYMLLLTQYGGKKVRCKQCGHDFTVPMPIEEEDADLQVVEEEVPSTAAAQPIAHAVSASTVGGPPYKRSEASRADIRRAFLEKYSPLAKLGDADVSAVQSELSAKTSLLEGMRDLHARALAQDHKYETNLVRYSSTDKGRKAEDQRLYEQAVMILGAAIPPERADYQKPPSLTPIVGEEGLSLKGLFSASTLKRLAQHSFEEVKRFKHEHIDSDPNAPAREAKIKTLAAAIEKLREECRALHDKLAACTASAAEARATRTAEVSTLVRNGERLIEAGSLSEGHESLVAALRKAPPELLPDVLVPLSICAFRDGNKRMSSEYAQVAICFGALPPVGLPAEYQELWLNSESGLPARELSDGEEVIAAAMTLVEQQKFAEAVASLTALLDEQPSNAEAHFVKGTALQEWAVSEQNAGRLKEAHDEFTSAHKLNLDYDVPAYATKPDGGIDWKKVGMVTLKVLIGTVKVAAMIAIAVAPFIAEGIGNRVNNSMRRGPGGGGRLAGGGFGGGGFGSGGFGASASSQDVGNRRTAAPPQPPVALQGCVFRGMRGNTANFSHKCESCGWVDSSTFTVTAGGTDILSSSFMCQKCKSQQPCRIQRV